MSEYVSLRELGYSKCDHPFREVYWTGPKYTMEDAIRSSCMIIPDQTDYQNTGLKCLWCFATMEDGEFVGGTVDFLIPFSKDYHPVRVITEQETARWEDYLRRMTELKIYATSN